MCADSVFLKWVMILIHTPWGTASQSPYTSQTISLTVYTSVKINLTIWGIFRDNKANIAGQESFMSSTHWHIRRTWTRTESMEELNLIIAVDCDKSAVLWDRTDYSLIFSFVNGYILWNIKICNKWRTWKGTVRGLLANFGTLCTTVVQWRSSDRHVKKYIALEGP